jgi:hypothetical protein
MPRRRNRASKLPVIHATPLENLEMETARKLDQVIESETGYNPERIAWVPKGRTKPPDTCWVFAVPLWPYHQNMLLGQKEGPVFPVVGFTKPIPPAFGFVSRRYHHPGGLDRLDWAQREAIRFRNALAFLGAERVPCMSAVVIPQMFRLPQYYERPDILSSSMQRDDWFHFQQFMLTSWKRLVDGLSPTGRIWRAVSLVGAAFWASEDPEIQWLYAWRAIELISDDDLASVVRGRPLPGPYRSVLERRLEHDWKSRPYKMDTSKLVRVLSERAGGRPLRQEKGTRGIPDLLTIRATLESRGFRRHRLLRRWRQLRNDAAHGSTDLRDFRSIQKNTGNLVMIATDLTTTKLIETGTISGVRHHDNNLSCLRPVPPKVPVPSA